MKFYKYLVLVFLIGFMSCKNEDWLNPDPSTRISDKTAFSSPERIENQVRGLYTQLKAGRFMGSWYQIVSDIRTGDYHCTNMNAATGSTMYSMLAQTTTTDVQNIWESGYLAINKVNVFLDNMELFGREVLEDAVYSNYVAEARLIRALAYYNLLQLYARPYWDGNGSKPGLPLRLVGNTAPGDYDLARSSVAETYDQIIIDLDFAENNLPSNYSSAELNTTRAHKNSAIALKTRAYLSMGNYPKVLEEAAKLVPSSGPFQAPQGVQNRLEANIADVFKAPYNSLESIFSLPFSSNDSPGLPLPSYYLPSAGDSGSSSSSGTAQYSLNENGILNSPLWAADDDRRTNFVRVGTSTRKSWLTKFSESSPYLDSAPVIRYAEVLLNYSEAIVRNTNTLDNFAIALFNAVYGRSNSGNSYTAGDFASPQAFLDRLVEERRIEFLGEGIRNADLMRLGLTIPGKSQHAINPVSPSDPNYILPISSDELVLNKLMDDND